MIIQLQFFATKTKLQIYIYINQKIRCYVYTKNFWYALIKHIKYFSAYTVIDPKSKLFFFNLLFRIL